MGENIRLVRCEGLKSYESAGSALVNVKLN